MTRNRISVVSVAVGALTLVVGLWGCGGGNGGSGPVTTVVTGVAATGAPMTGTAFLKDAAGHSELSSPIMQNGSFSFNVGGQTPPFMLRASSLYSMSGGPGTANINPLTNLMVADMGAFGNMSSLNTFYRNPDSTKMKSMFSNLSTARTHVRQTMAPLLAVYGVPNVDPVMSQFVIGQGMDRMFDDVKMGIDQNGNVTMFYVNGTPVFTGMMSNIMGGTMLTGNIVVPGASTITSGVTVTPAAARLPVGGTQQFTANIPVTWSVLSTNGGSITANGLYTAPVRQGMFMIKATSIADPTRTTFAVIQVGSMGMM